LSKIWFGNDFQAFLNKSAPPIQKPTPWALGLCTLFCASGFFNLQYHYSIWFPGNREYYERRWRAEL